MGFIYDERLSDSPYIESITVGHTAGNGSVIRPAECNWHMVFVKHQGGYEPLVVGPLMTSGVVNFIEGVEILWLKFKLGTFMPHMPIKKLMEKEMRMPEAGGRKSFWLNGAAWQFPNYENVENFVNKLVREDVLTHDPVVATALKDEPQDISLRTVRHRFLYSTGMTQKYIRQMKRAHQAAALLRQGVSILDTIYETGYFDQPHLTRSLKLFIGHTPAQILPKID